MVPGKHNHIVRVIPLYVRDILVNRVGGPPVPVGAAAALVGRQHAHAGVGAVQIPRLPVPDVLVQLQRLVLSQHADALDPGIDTVGKRKVDDPVFPPERDGGLCEVLRQDPQPAALTPRQQHGDNFLFWQHCRLPHSQSAVFRSLGFSPMRRAFARRGAFRLHLRKITESGGNVRLMDCRQPCIGGAELLISLPFVRPLPP